MEIPFSQACANNQEPILKVLESIGVKGNVLELGHGTGQHALYFAPRLPVTWHSSDRKENLWMLGKRIGLPENLIPSIELEIGKKTIPSQVHKKFDVAFTANTLHIMSFENARKFCEEIGSVLTDGADLIIYGPFKFGGDFTSESNRQFDLHLKSQSSEMGIRDFEIIKKTLSEFLHIKTYPMPANNFILHFKKS